MWTVIALLGIVAAAAVSTLRVISSKSSHDPRDQHGVAAAEHTSVVVPGDLGAQHDAEGNPIPGSEACRTEHGKR